MKVVIATCFKSNEERVEFVKEVFELRGDNVTVITTDFDHIKHSLRTDYKNDYQYIKTLPYQKNISIKRIQSHIQFSSDLFKNIESIKPDIIWLMAPANSLIKRASIYKTKIQNVKLIIDIIDMWPESLPVNINKDIIPFKIWKNLRAKYITCADYLVTECEFYKSILNKEYKQEISTIHWAREQRAIKTSPNIPKNVLSLLYLGSINNIIDIQLIVEVIKKMNQHVILHIVGAGENKDVFINALKPVCEVVDHGEQRDISIKTEIIKQCHAGLNLYQNNLFIGLTVKSIDYLEFGLPIINNIKGDTWSLIQNNKVGFNIDQDIQFNSEDIKKMRSDNNHIYETYESMFIKDVFIHKCNDVIEEVLK